MICNYCGQDHPSDEICDMMWGKHAKAVASLLPKIESNPAPFTHGSVWCDCGVEISQCGCGCKTIRTVEKGCDKCTPRVPKRVITDSIEHLNRLRNSVKTLLEQVAKFNAQKHEILREIADYEYFLEKNKVDYKKLEEELIKKV